MNFYKLSTQLKKAKVFNYQQNEHNPQSYFHGIEEFFTDITLNL